MGLSLLLVLLAACTPTQAPAPTVEVITPVSTQVQMGPTTAQISLTPTPTITPSLEPTLLPVDASTPEAEITIPPEVVAAVQTQYAVLQTPVTPTPSYRRPTRTPTPSPTPSQPLAVLRIYKPGPYSRLTSPFTIEGAVVTGPGGKIYLELIGEDGRMISQDTLRFGMADGLRFGIVPEVKFEIGSVAETGRLQLRTENTHGQTIALTSIKVILLSLGDPELNAGSTSLEPYVIQTPHTDAEISGGILAVKGLVRPVNDSPILVELRSDDDTLLGSTQFTAEIPEGSLNTAFNVALPYSVTARTHALLVFKQEGDRIPGLVALTSTALWLNP